MVYIRGESWLLKEKQCIVPVESSKLNGPLSEDLESFGALSKRSWDKFDFAPPSFKYHRKSDVFFSSRSLFAKCAVKEIHEVERRKTLFIPLNHFRETFWHHTKLWQTNTLRVTSNCKK